MQQTRGEKSHAARSCEAPPPAGAAEAEEEEAEKAEDEDAPPPSAGRATGAAAPALSAGGREEAAASSSSSSESSSTRPLRFPSAGASSSESVSWVGWLEEAAAENPAEEEEEAVAAAAAAAAAADQGDQQGAGQTSGEWAICPPGRADEEPARGTAKGSLGVKLWLGASMADPAPCAQS
eukprot:CAMPEP_0180236096 /NCGR_PEP_ID=MMETSP0987-20121128/29580_1 /TAXON_ID=697907 /ORGANISM="non described non described, Strain CCMP2293" /LENGTH=179 /DNA_ID=CAMNT_0022202265 /DNA_START=803 /DNA_END=1343 /DNA_ORIENTATION=-